MWYLLPHCRFRVHTARAHIPRSDHLGPLMLNLSCFSCPSSIFPCFMPLDHRTLKLPVVVSVVVRWRTTAIPYQPSDTASGRAREPWPRRVALAAMPRCLGRDTGLVRCAKDVKLHISLEFKPSKNHTFTHYSRCRLRAEHSSSPEGKSIFIEIKRSNPLPHLSSSSSP